MSDDKIAPQHETHAQLAQRQGVTTKTLDRWVDVGVLPEPLRIHGRKYWPRGIEPQRDAGKRSKPVGRSPYDVTSGPEAA